MNHLVLGGTGTVGGAVVRGLLARGERVRVLTRTAAGLAKLPAGAAGVVGDMTEPDTYPATFEGVDTVFVLNPVSITELHEGLAAVNEARRARVKRLVYLSIHDVENDPHIPHFGAKVAIEAAIHRSGVPFTILRPNNFYQNDFWYREAIQRYGVYPQPIGGVGLSRVDVRDIADAAVNALTTAAHEGRTYALVGPQAVTGEWVAAAWAHALGRDVRYGGDDLDAFAATWRQWLPAWMVYDFSLMYRMFQTRGLAATDAQVEETTVAAGHAPRPFAAFAAETAAAWQAEEALATV